MSSPISVRLSDGSKLEVAVVDLDAATVLLFKEQISAALPDKPPASSLKIVFKGKILRDEDLLSVAGIEAGSAVHMVRSRSVAPPPSLPSSSSTNTGGGGGGLGGLLQSPLLASLVDNPDFMRDAVLANPSTRALLDANPGLRSTLLDPDQLRLMMSAARSPELMREVTRSNDLALSNIEAMPGGQAALARMLTEVGAPLEDSLRESFLGGSGGPDTNAAPQGASGSALPNPWARQDTAGVPPPAHANLFGGGGLGGLSGGANPAAVLGALNSNPGMRSMMAQMMGSPAFLDAASASNPQLRALLESNPMMRSLLGNPAMVEAMLSPEALSAAMGAGAAQVPSPPSPPSVSQAGAPFNPAQLMQMMQMMGGLGGGGSSVPAMHVPGARPPAERFASQLASMHDMGFGDDAQCLRALTATHGNVQMAVERILDGRD